MKAYDLDRSHRIFSILPHPDEGTIPTQLLQRFHVQTQLEDAVVLLLEFPLKPGDGGPLLLNARVGVVLADDIQGSSRSLRQMGHAERAAASAALSAFTTIASLHPR